MKNILYIIKLILLISTLNGYGQLLPDENITEIERLAKKGDGYSMNTLGELYLRGIVHPKNYTKAKLLFEKSSKKGIGIAQYYLGYIYEYGLGTFKDTVESNKFYEKAFKSLIKLKEKSDPRIKYCLARLSQKSILKNNEENDIDDLEFYKQSLNSGYSPAAFRIGYFYHSGDEKKNIDSAINFYEKAIEMGNTISINNLAVIYMDEEKKKDTIKAITLYEKASSLGNDYSMNNLGNHYYYNKENYEEALKWHIKAAETNEKQRQFKLALLYENGYKIDRDYKKSFYWFSEAAKNFSAEACYKLGWYYYDGLETNKDIKKAKELFEKAKKHGHPQAANALDAIKTIK